MKDYVIVVFTTISRLCKQQMIILHPQSHVKGALLQFHLLLHDIGFNHQ